MEYDHTVLKLARTTKVLTAESIRAANAAVAGNETMEHNAKSVNEIHTPRSYPTDGIDI